MCVMGAPQCLNPPPPLPPFSLLNPLPPPSSSPSPSFPVPPLPPPPESSGKRGGLQSEPDADTKRPRVGPPPGPAVPPGQPVPPALEIPANPLLFHLPQAVQAVAGAFVLAPPRYQAARPAAVPLPPPPPHPQAPPPAAIPLPPPLAPAPYVPPLQHLLPLNNNNHHLLHPPPHQQQHRVRHLRHHHHLGANEAGLHPHDYNLDLPMHYGPPDRYYRRF